MALKAYPLSGEPETFRYHQNEQVVTRNKDGRTLDSMDDFFCYAFQCDAEGYPGTTKKTVHHDSEPFL
ncbi:hypothetical protein [Syntrophaceticus schinkii]|uniref:hypothetical protein n=1 Tax=Syntrophaceticus schinkii TaxID=499207 RepID=UPI0012EC4C8D|nr:hypothetical protein [Syntrophaceticus schinkii]MDD2359749.1 hypothetical protein [Syntrophaceticus schinkii]